MNLNTQVAINSLSFGNCSVNILLELFKKEINPNIFPISNKVELEAFDKVSEDFKKWLATNINKALLEYKKEYPSFTLWHINGSQSSIGEKNYLYTFNECDGLTPTEVNILNNQEKVFVSSPYNKDVFEKSGVKNVTYIPLGFDSLHFKKIEKRLAPKDVTVFGLFGKFEKRKASVDVVKAWLKKYGNNSKYMLNVAFYNPFFTPEQNQQFRAIVQEGKSYTNINFLPFVKTNTEVNNMVNACDIVLGMSKSECWGLPEFHAVALGKFAVIHAAAGYLAWANDKNATLVNPSGKETVYDGVFFHPNLPFNQGSYYTWNEAEFIAAMEMTDKRFKEEKVNVEGLKLQQEFTWTRTVDEILNNIK